MKRRKKTNTLLAALMGVVLASEESLLYQDLLGVTKKQKRIVEPKRPDIPVFRVQPKRKKKRK